MDFILNGKQQQVGICDANLTLLDYLRGDAAMKGTKEGCASGDCGACTVLLAALGQPPRAINACITPLGSAANKQVWTVEALTREGGLHPVQQALVDCNGSQCGFCTPGFVMALTALYANSQRCGLQQLDRDSVTDAISGNLCRCTGYRPIVEAGTKMLQIAPAAPTLVQKPASLQPLSTNSMQPQLSDGEHSFFQPATEAELQQLLALYPQAALVAGATDLGLELTQRHRQFAQLISVGAIPSMARFEWQDDQLLIGAALPYTDLESRTHELSIPLKRLLHRLGSRQIRNQGTIGGNIANGSPVADMPPVLLAWDADIEIVDSSGKRTWHPLSSVYLGYRLTIVQAGQYIARIRIRRAALERPHRFYKVSKRFEDDISAVLGAFSLELAGGRLGAVRLAFGGVAATPVRATATEALLTGSTLSDALIASACDTLKNELKPISDVRASSAYRSEMAANTLRRALLELGSGLELEVHHYPAGNEAALYV